MKFPIIRIYIHIPRSVSVFCISLLLLFCSSCGPLTNPSTSHQTSAEQGWPNSVGTITKGNAQTASAGQKESAVPSCPSENTARPALMRTLSTNKQANLVYISNESQKSTRAAGHLMRYDVATDTKSEIVSLTGSIEFAQVSADGEWVLFLSAPSSADTSHRAILHLVRIDGQELQTLYCIRGKQVQAGGPADTVQWSPDQKSVLISSVVDDTLSTITLLSLNTGTLRNILQLTDKDHISVYRVFKWLDNKHVYLLKQGRRPGTHPAITLSLFDLAANQDSTGRNLQTVFTRSEHVSNWALDSNPEGDTLYSAYCMRITGAFDSKVTSARATGGDFATVYQAGSGICIGDMHAISDTTLLVCVRTFDAKNRTHRKQLWTLKTNGSARRILYDLPETDSVQRLNHFTPYTWSDVSRDHNWYAIQTFNSEPYLQTLAVGTLAGGTPKTVDTATSGWLAVVGFGLF